MNLGVQEEGFLLDLCCRTRRVNFLLLDISVWLNPDKPGVFRRQKAVLVQAGMYWDVPGCDGISWDILGHVGVS